MKYRNKILIVILILTVAIGLFFYPRPPMDDAIQLSPLPQGQLWNAKQAEDMLEKAFSTGIPHVRDEEALLLLVEHAWQWDKNAMIQYARIVQSEREIKPERAVSLSTFLRRNRHHLVNSEGRRLSEPAVLQLPYRQLIEKLANSGYPYPSHIEAIRLIGGAGVDSENEYKALPPDMYQKMLRYIQYSIEGDYRNYDLLADTIFFKTGYPYKDYNHTQLNKLTEHAHNLSIDELKQATAAYETCAKAGSRYCIVRMQEIFLYGIGHPVDIEQSYLWGLRSAHAYQLWLEKPADKNDLFKKMMEENLHQYSTELLETTQKDLTQEQQKRLRQVAEQTESDMNWDYATWVKTQNYAPPKP
jgi:hypothetical protein